MDVRNLGSPFFVMKGEVTENCGEDSYTTGCVEDQFYYQGVFDGCGGLGARTYAQLHGHTGAWAASRAAGMTTDRFMHEGKLRFLAEDGPALQRELAEDFKKLKNAYTENGGITIRGSLSRSFPTTAAIAAIRPETNNTILCEFLWAGDSRGYILDQYGLSQVTRDDIDSDADALENLKQDGRLVNTINADVSFEVHVRQVRLNLPSVVITATDGGFSYFETPMNFEAALLATLRQANVPEEWEEGMNALLRRKAGDDFTLAISCFGFADFTQVKNYFYNRFTALTNTYGIHSDKADYETLKKLWEDYKRSYYRWDGRCQS